MRGGQKAFTLIEVLISIAIIGLLIALIIPNIDRNLSKNSVAYDAELFKAKLEEVRLMSGSTQQIDETPGNAGTGLADDTRYYAIVLHRLNPADQQFFSIVRISSPYGNPNPGQCNFTRFPNVIAQAVAQEGPCFVQRVTLSRGVKITVKAQETQAGPDTFLVAYKAPTQQMTMFTRPNVAGSWTEVEPIFSDPAFELTYKGKKANVKIDDFTGRVSVQYE